MRSAENNEFEYLDMGGFVSQYMSAGDEKFTYSDKPFQIYPLSIATRFIKPPVPLFRAHYNFLLLFSSGGGRQQIDNEILELRTNDVLFIREGHLNAIKAINPDTDGFYIYIDNVLLPAVTPDGGLLHRFSFSPKSSVTSSDMEWLCSCCRLLLPREGSNHSIEVLSSVLRAMLLKISDSSQMNMPKLNRSAELTMLFKEALYKNFRQNRDVGYYAGLLAVSENYLNRCVKMVTRKPPKQHINEMVILHSKILLQNRTSDIAQIAFDLNFSDPSHFGRLFKQVTNLTPTEYRAAWLQEMSG